MGSGVEVLIGRDTRRSGPMLEGALAAGLAGGGVNVRLLGVLPTPALAEAVGACAAAAGAVISASHNPFPDNGIKLFGADGFKLADADEAAVEALLGTDGPRPEGAALGAIAPDPAARERYIESLIERRPVDLAGLTIVMDCANGAGVATAPVVLERLGARVRPLAVEPDGVNINVDCGSTHLDSLSAAVRAEGADLGLALDGDGDRMLAVDHLGRVVDGDQILAICALHLHRHGALAGDTVVTTTMTNLGFRRAMSAAGITVRWTDVGDRYVLAEMLAGGYILGGEQSGHLINLRHGPSGDGLAAGLHLLSALVEGGQTLAQAGAVVERLPQRLVSVGVARKADLPRAAGMWAAVRACERELGDDGRVVVRASGTEPLVRVMVEAPSDERCQHWCDTIAALAVQELGGVDRADPARAADATNDQR